jgi:hypothetical protein
MSSEQKDEECDATKMPEELKVDKIVNQNTGIASAAPRNN